MRNRRLRGSMRPIGITLVASALLVGSTPGVAAALEPEPRRAGTRAADSILVDATPPALPPADATSEQNAPQPPPPKHGTGFGALFKETGRDFVAFTRRPSTWVILGVGGAAAAISHPADDSVNAHLAGSDFAAAFFAPGQYIGSAWVQGGAAVGVYLIGRFALPKQDGVTANKTTHVGFDLIRAQLVAQGLVQGIKVAVRRDRPTGECCAFPSGHAASAFAAASVLERHFGGYRGAWPTMLVAAYVGASRLHDNRHFLSDVIFGSAVGMATGWTIVGRHGRSEFALSPTPVPGGFAVMVSRTEH